MTKKLLLVAAMLVAVPLLTGCLEGLEGLDFEANAVEPQPTSGTPVLFEISRVQVREGFVVDVPIYVTTSASSMRLVIGGRELFNGSGVCAGQLLGSNVTIASAGVAVVTKERRSGLTFNPYFAKAVGGAADARWRVCVSANNENGSIAIDAIVQPGASVAGKQLLATLRFLGQRPGRSPLEIDPLEVKAYTGPNTRVLVQVANGEILVIR